MKSKISRYAEMITFGLCSRLFSPNVHNTFGYKKQIDHAECAVYKRPIGAKKIEAAFGNTVVLSNRKNKIIIYPDDRYPMIRHTVKFDRKHFPDLLPGSRLLYCMVLPYLRKVTPTSMEKARRVVVVTDKAQIYHNYPARKTDCEGKSEPGDIACFEESVVWDLPQRRHPAKTVDCAEYERYYPGLPEAVYTRHPAVGRKSKFGNAGFADCFEANGEKLPRFYIPRREEQGNPFFYMSGFEPDYKMSLIGTYRSNVSVGVRTCVFATDDGGRQWFCKYEFGDMGEYAFTQGSAKWGCNFGNPILSAEGTWLLKKRTCVIPSSENKEPMEKFRWAEEVKFSSVSGEKQLTLRASAAHGYETGNIVCVSSAPENSKWMENSEVSAVSAGNGLLFKVEKVDETTIRLHELAAAPDNPISCRHIHHINRVRDGFIIGTGEIYPNSWLLYMQMREADTFTVKNAGDPFDVYRLNSSETAVQRTLGFLWREDGEDTILFASDHDILEKEPVSPIPGRELSFVRGATGVYRGTLADIDNINRFTPVFEATEPAYLLRDLGRALVFSGQRGEVALSFDGGDRWTSFRVDSAFNHPKGSTKHLYVYDDYLLEIK